MDIGTLADAVRPDDASARLVGRVYDPEVGGPCIAAIRDDRVVDITSTEPTMSGLLERSDRLEVADSAPGRSWDYRRLLQNTFSQSSTQPRFLAPCDLQVLKAAGVTFVSSMLERVIEERASGDAAAAEAIRAQVSDAVGTAIGSVRPGSPEAARVKLVLEGEGLWSQYLEVGIGPDPEIFTKAPITSAVGVGGEIGVLERSSWNNPEPELVLAVSSTGVAVGACLGNDVNLRDFEGRSALLLTEAKDNNASCSIGPFIRLFDDAFGLAGCREITITTRITGDDGFSCEFTGFMSDISRPLQELIDHTVGPHHQYPDGFMLFTGTSYAPTVDRDEPGDGFTHKRGDIVEIRSAQLGTLVNRVTTSELAPPWRFGVRSLIQNLAERGLLPAGAPR